MSRGARPLPTALKLIRRTHRPDRDNPWEPQLPVVVPPAPRWLNALGRAAWRELAPILATKMRVLTAADARGLAQLCDTIAVYRAARAILERDGMTFSVQTESGRVIRARPEVAIAQDADRRIRAWQAEYGLSPASRCRVNARPELDGENSLAAMEKRRRFFGKGTK